MIDEDEKRLFRQSLDKVKTLKQEPRASGQDVFRQQIRLDTTKSAQRKAAMGEVQSGLDALMALTPMAYKPEETMLFKQSGVQEGVCKKMRTGKYDVEAKLDLHGMTVQQALLEISRFINRSEEEGFRCVLISHGKGIKQDEPAKLKNHLAAWLTKIPQVLAYSSAQAKEGGAGSVYVLLKKNEQQRLQNRQRFSQLPDDK